ncbi:MAG: Asp-tRNA(Asn)/Glu-tRNA(Gln) amidotransferase subunit GatC [SAR202 cluster bacterium]|nr:Asp-tRNA(Asn)/Glu-tRNA(Gln) amidotransferase subunit GatC [SAR202 cluster bacterium]
MAERLTTEEVRHIAKLARVGMTDDEVERMRGQLSNILEHFDALSRLDVTNVEPTAQSIDVSTVLRDDEARGSLPLDDVLANAPRTEGELIRVRAVIEE